MHHQPLARDIGSRCRINPALKSYLGRLVRIFAAARISAAGIASLRESGMSSTSDHVAGARISSASDALEAAEAIALRGYDRNSLEPTPIGIRDIKVVDYIQLGSHLGIQTSRPRRSSNCFRPHLERKMVMTKNRLQLKSLRILSSVGKSCLKILASIKLKALAKWMMTLAALKGASEEQVSTHKLSLWIKL